MPSPLAAQPDVRAQLDDTSRLERRANGADDDKLRAALLAVAPDGRRVLRMLVLTRAIPASPDEYPEHYTYDETSQELHVGAGIFAPVSPSVWGVSVSDMRVLSSWLDYRMKGGAGRRSSPLDDIRPTTWPAAFTEELLRVVWVLEHTLDLMPRVNALLVEVCGGATFSADELPTPSEEERKAPEQSENEHPTLDLGE